MQAFADAAADALAHFNKYVQAANSYSNAIENMYADDARIIRQVVKPDGSTANATTNKSTYVKQMRLSSIAAKAKGYKNYYSDVSVAKVANGYKVSSFRQPTGESYKLKAYQVWQKQPDGKWVIVEELMQTKEQIFLKYADK
jgi:ketosteroid isomerase-like protein